MKTEPGVDEQIEVARRDAFCEVRQSTFVIRGPFLWMNLTYFFCASTDIYGSKDHISIFSWLNYLFYIFHVRLSVRPVQWNEFKVVSNFQS